jgi:hypothetical protein
MERQSMTDERLLTISQRAASSLETLQTSYDMARLAIDNNVPGDFVECGVFAGAQCAAMALAIQDGWTSDGRTPKPWPFYEDFPPVRHIHLFDTFAGVPAAGEHDKQWREAGHPAGQSCASLADVQNNMREWGIDKELLYYHRGLFADTVPPWDVGHCDVHSAFKVIVPDGERVAHCPMCGRMCPVGAGDGSPVKQIAILRLDGDLYQSTEVCLEYLYPLVSPGGWIICDDYGLDGARKAINEYWERKAGYPLVIWQKQ